MVKKCKSLIGTLLKAKQEKDGAFKSNVPSPTCQLICILSAMVARTRELEETIATFEEQKSADKTSLKAMQEIVSALTEQKLQMAGQLQEWQDKATRTDKVQLNNNELSIENESLKRQLKRITDENDDLISEVSGLEAKLLAVNSIGEEQQKHFLQLEESTNKLLHVEQQYNEATQTIGQLEEDKKSLQTKMRSYKGKIIEIVAKFRRLKASHKATLEVVQEYSNSIPNWQEELRRVAEVISTKNREKKDVVSEENRPEISNSRVAELETTVEDLKRQLDSNRKVMSQVEAEKLQIIDGKSQFEAKSKDLENKLMAKKQENSDLLQEMKELNEIMKERGETISKQQSELSQTRTVNEDLQGDLHKIQSILSEREQTIRVLIEDNKTKGRPADDSMSTSTISKLDESTTSSSAPKESIEASDEKYSKLKAMAVKLKKRLDEEMKKVKALEESQAAQSAAEIVTAAGAEQVAQLEKSLAEAIEREKASKAEAEKFKGFAKKYNMLALEMESYEKSMEAQTDKFNQKQTIIRELEQTIEEQQATIATIKEQMRLVEERSSSEVDHNKELYDQINKLTATVRELEHHKAEHKAKVEQDEDAIRGLKEKLEGLNNELATIKRNNQSSQEITEQETNKIKSNLIELETQLKSTSTKLRDKEEELQRLEKEYSGYKIRAQSILQQQSQSNVNSGEKELQEELETVKRLMAATEQSLNASVCQIKELEKSIQLLTEEKGRNANRFAETLTALEDLKQLNGQLKLENRAHLEEQQNSLKSHRLNVDTLTSVFKSQIEGLEKKVRDQEGLIQDLSNSNRLQVAQLETIAKRSSTDEEKIVEMRMNLERQSHQQEDNLSGRGAPPSHARIMRKVSSNSGGLMPLEDLLNSNFDEADYGGESAIGGGDYPPNAEDERKMQAKESQIRHLTTLLAEAEQDVAKLNQQNDLLKEEIRRQQRSEERDAHINNSEYLKNVIFKVGRQSKAPFSISATK